MTCHTGGRGGGGGFSSHAILATAAPIHTGFQTVTFPRVPPGMRSIPPHKRRRRDTRAGGLLKHTAWVFLKTHNRAHLGTECELRVSFVLWDLETCASTWEPSALHARAGAAVSRTRIHLHRTPRSRHSRSVSTRHEQAKSLHLRPTSLAASDSAVSLRNFGINDRNLAEAWRWRGLAWRYKRAVHDCAGTRAVGAPACAALPCVYTP